MQISIPFFYRAEAIPNRGNAAREVLFLETARFDIPEVSSAAAPVAIAWKQPDADIFRHTRYFGGSHWVNAPMSDDMKGAIESLSGTPLARDAAKAMLTLAPLFKLTATDRRLVGEAADASENAHFQGEKAILLDDKIKTYRLADETAELVRQKAMRAARLRAYDLMTCEGEVYIRCQEPTLRLSLLSEKRPPNTLVAEVSALDVEFREAHKTNLPQHTFRIDRLDDFLMMVREHPEFEVLGMENRIGEIQVLDNTTLSYRDDLSAMRTMLAAVLAGFDTTNPMSLSDEAISFYRETKPDQMAERELESVLRGLTEGRHAAVSAMPDPEAVRRTIKVVLDRWDMRPLGSDNSPRI